MNLKTKKNPDAKVKQARNSMTNNNVVYIGIGSNKGNKIEYIREAVRKIQEDENCSVTVASSVYETKPYGFKEQDNFFNAAIGINTSLSFNDLLPLLKKIEKDIGRTKNPKWGPREIDLDLLFFNDLIYEDERLTIPHKEVQYRDFVLVPLCEIAPELIHPALNVKICDICIDESEKCIIGRLSDKIL